jgi:hypothetical protein
MPLAQVAASEVLRKPRLDRLLASMKISTFHDGDALIMPIWQAMSKHYFSFP